VEGSEGRGYPKDCGSAACGAATVKSVESIYVYDRVSPGRC
jgi:hypothetical protein